jgi:cytoskeletal protein CcmA (bactofilin family)
MAVSNNLLVGVRNEIARMWKTKDTDEQSVVASPNFETIAVTDKKENEPPKKSTLEEKAPQKSQDSAQFFSMTKAERPKSGEPSFIGEHISIEGIIKAEEDMVIEGAVKGSIHIKGHVTIGKKGRIEADIQASSVSILGNVTGDVTAANKVHISSSAQYVGRIKARGFSVDDGAYLKATIELDKDGKDRLPAQGRPVDAIMFSDAQERKMLNSGSVKTGFQK